jgi:hypothetical protein
MWGRDWEFLVGWSCTDKEMDAIQQLPKGAWRAGFDQNGDLVSDTLVADLTGLLDLDSWHNKIPDLRIIVRDEPLRPRYRKRATEREKQLGRRYQLIAANTKVGQVAWLAARHRSYVPISRDVPAGTCRIDQQRGEPLHPPIDGHVVYLDAALGEQLFHVSVGQSVTEVPTYRNHDHAWREPETGEAGPRHWHPGGMTTHQPSLPGLALLRRSKVGRPVGQFVV